VPPKSRRKKQLDDAREAKRLKRAAFCDEEEVESEAVASDLLDESGVYVSDDDDESYDPDNDDKPDMEAVIHGFAQEWVESLNRDDVMALSMFLHSLLVFRLHLSLTDSAVMIGDLLGYSDRTVREWRSAFVNNNGSFPDSDQGTYQRSGVSLEQ